MKLYMLSFKGHVGWDEYDSMVVCAKSSAQARKIASEKAGWRDNSFTCEVLKAGSEPCVVIASFNAG